MVAVAATMDLASFSAAVLWSSASTRTFWRMVSATSCLPPP
jgi:hypothetical protein